MGKKTVTYGVVGLKRGAELAIEGLGFTDAKLVAACDCNPDTLASAKKTLEEKGLCDCTYFLDFEEFLKSDFDAVIIATDATNHVPLVLRALDAGKHVLCEIPSVNSVEEAKILKQAVKDAIWESRIPSDHDSAYAFMMQEAERMGLFKH